MHLLGVKKVQICPFKGTAPATSCCTPKGTILNPYFSVCKLGWCIMCYLHSSSGHVWCVRAGRLSHARLYGGGSHQRSPLLWTPQVSWCISIMWTLFKTTASCKLQYSLFNLIEPVLHDLVKLCISKLAVSLYLTSRCFPQKLTLNLYINKRCKKATVSMHFSV